MRIERWLHTLPLKWRSLARRDEVEQDLDDEIRDHLERRVEEFISQGISLAQARVFAASQFGPVDVAKERCRDARGLQAIDSTMQDVRYALRTLRRNPGYTIVAVLTLALGIGVNAAVYSLVDGILLAPLPYSSPDRLISVTGTYPNGAFAALRDQVRTVDVAAYAEGHWVTLESDGTTARLATTRISAELLAILGTSPLFGRWPHRGEDLAPHDRVIVLSYGLWASRFNRDPSIVGRFVRIDDVPRQVIAVMPASFRFPSRRTEAWIPLGMEPTNQSHYWAGDFMPIIGRLQVGRTAAQAHDEIRAFQSRVGKLFPWPMPDDWNRTIGVQPLQSAMVASARTRLLILIVAVALVLAIACANVANLTLSRAVSREREIGIRTALGASPRRIARQLLTESIVIAAIAAVVGVILETQALAVLRLVLPPDTPRLDEVTINWRVVAVTGCLAILTGCAFGVLPALYAMRLRVRTMLEAGGRMGGTVVTGPVRAVLTIAQVACAVLLVIAAGLLVRSLWTLSTSDPGFAADGVLTASVSRTQPLCPTPEQCLAFYRTFENDLRNTPGVESAAMVNTLPLTGAVAKRSLELEGVVAEQEPLFWMHVITPDYFRVMRIHLESGRAFTPEDLTGPPVAVITAASANHYWPGRSPLGRQIRFVGDDRWRTIVGVVADVRAYTLARSEPEWIKGTIYVPHSERTTLEDGRIPMEMTLTLRTTQSQDQVRAMLGRLSANTASRLTIGDVRPMSDIVAEALAAPSATVSLLISMAVVAVVLGCIGVYGVISFLVSRQTREFGIRLALGAHRRDVFWLVIKAGARLCVTGIVLGVLGAAAISRWLSSELYGVSPMDPATYVSVVLAVFLVTLLACYVPTRRAMAVDPLIVIREP